MKQTLLALAVTLALFCALYGLFMVVGVSKYQPAPSKAPAPEMKAPKPHPKQVWV